MSLQNSADNENTFAGSEIDRFLSRAEIEAITGLSYTTLWRRMKVGEFPSPVQLSPNRVGWPKSAIVDWVQGRIAASAG